MAGHDDKKNNTETTRSLADRISEFEGRKSNLQDRKAKAQMPAEGMALAGKSQQSSLLGLSSAVQLDGHWMRFLIHHLFG